MSFREKLNQTLIEFQNKTFSHVIEAFEKTLTESAEKGLESGTGFVLLSQTPLSKEQNISLKLLIERWAIDNKIEVKFLEHMNFLGRCRLDCHYQLSLKKSNIPELHNPTPSHY